MSWTDLCVIIVLIQLALLVIALHIYIIEWIIYGKIITEAIEIYRLIFPKKKKKEASPFIDGMG